MKGTLRFALALALGASMALHAGPGLTKAEREQLLTTENNAWGAAWTMGSSDRSIPKDMGAIIAGYILTVGAKK